MPKVLNQTIELPSGQIVEFRDDQVRAMISGQFSVEKPYNKNEVVIYDDQFWKFYSDHPAGEWRGTDARQVTIGEIILSSDDITEILSDSIATPEEVQALFA